MNNYLIEGSIGASIIITLGIIYKFCNHKQCRTKLCGRECNSSVDIEQTEPIPKIDRESRTQSRVE